MRILLPSALAPLAQRRFPWAPAVAISLAVLVLTTALALGAPARPLSGLAAVTTPVPAPTYPTLPTSHPGTVSGFATAAPTAEGWYRVPTKGVSPGSREGAAMAFDAKDGYVVLFGGCGRTCPMADTWKYSGGIWVNLTSQLVTAPPARSGASMVYDAKDGYLLLYGGVGPGGALGDTWKFVGGSWSQLTIAGAVPAPRSAAAAAYDSVDSAVLLFGGLSTTGVPLGDMWSYAGGNWTSIPSSATTSPAARSLAGFAFDSSDGYAVLVGGTGPCGTPCGDVWTYVAGHWTNRTGSSGAGPSPRSAPTVGYDPGRDVLVLYGGTNTTVLGDTWTYAAGTWTDVSGSLSATPAARSAGSATWDATDNYLFLFGGADGTTLRPWSWALLTPLTATVRPTAGSVFPGAGDTFSASVSGGLAPYNYSWGFGDGSSTGLGPTVGHTYATAGTYAVSLTVTDALATTVAAVVNVTVTVPPLLVAISATPQSPRAGESVTVSANASGGTAPYLFHWSGRLAGCTTVSPSALTCVEPVVGIVDFGVTVTDAAGRTASTATNVTVLAPAGSLSTSSVANRPSTLGWPTTLEVTALVLAMIAACLGAVLTYRAGRRRELARIAERPHCYAVPAWSETPPELSSPSDDPTRR